MFSSGKWECYIIFVIVFNSILKKNLVYGLVSYSPFRKIKCLPRALKNVPTEEDVGNLEVEVNKEHVRDTYAVPSLSVFYGLGKYPVLKGLESTVALLGDGGNFRRGIR
jgi:hypothetical protein